MGIQEEFEQVMYETCKECNGCGEITEVDSYYFVDKHIRCNNCDGKGFLDWIGRLTRS